MDSRATGSGVIAILRTYFGAQLESDIEAAPPQELASQGIMPEHIESTCVMTHECIICARLDARCKPLKSKVLPVFPDPLSHE